MNNNRNASRKTANRIGLVMAIVLVLILTLAGCGSSSSKTIDLMEYVSLSFSGDNGRGRTAQSFDYGAFEDALAEALDADENSAQFFADVLIIEDGIQISLDKTTDLSNGDEVTLVVRYNEAAAKDYKLSFQGGSVSSVVSGLTEVAEFTATESDAMALLSETTVLHYMQDIPLLPERISNLTLAEPQVNYQVKTANLDYSFDMDCEIAILSVQGTIQYKYENDAWTNIHISRISEVKEYTLEGTYTGTEWDIAGNGISCNATYEITKKDDGSYEASVTWNANNESPTMPEHTATIPLENVFDTSRFLISNIHSEIKAPDGRSPYLYRALGFDFIAGGFSRSGEVELKKVS